MRKITYNYRVNQGWNNYPAQVEVTVDDDLFEILSIIQGVRGLAEGPTGEHIFVHQMGVMSQDRGFKWVSLSKRQHGQDMGMFYCGIPTGSEYVDLDMLKADRENHYKDLLKTA